MKYWIFKSEPNEFSIDDLKAAPKKTEAWNGIRNYQVRNFIRDEMKKGDQVLFYHSRAEQTGIVGLAEIVREAYPDHTQFDSKSKYYDAKSTNENPRWLMVDLKFKKKFSDVLTLSAMREIPKLKNLLILRKGNRLSITPVEKKDFDNLLSICEGS